MKIIKVMGGLGNQMFQYVLYLKLKSLGIETYLDDRELNKYGNQHNGAELYKVFGIKGDEMPNKANIEYYCWKIIQVLLFKFGISRSPRYFYKDDHSGELQKLLRKQKYLIGYWQDIRYFDDIEPNIRDSFSFSEENIGEKNRNVKSGMFSCNSVSIHVRRGDYLGEQERVDICTLNYYKSAVEYIKNKYYDSKFYIFSDDVQWVTDNFNWIDYKIIDWNTGSNSYIDMYLMSQCKHNIIANSTFSWWGAWLNNNANKLVVSPSIWYRGIENHLTLKEWVSISPEGSVLDRNNGCAEHRR